MHGCKEGQCAACKSFVLEGDMDDIDLERYSTFALPDYEKEEGQTLLCRAHAYYDLVIELLHYDEEIIRNGLPLKKGVAEVVANDAVTHDMRHLVLKLIEPTDGIKFFPGQYLDLMVPGTDESRSFSMANTPGREGRFEFVIKVYPDGLFSEYLATKLAVGDRLDVEGPFGTFTLRESHNSPIVFLGGGAGMAPVLGLLRSMAERGVDRQARLLLRGPRAAGPLLRRRAPGAGEQDPRLPVRPGALRARRGRRVGRRGRAHHRGVEAVRAGPVGEGRLRVRAAADGRRGDPRSHVPRRARAEHLLRQVHHHW